MALIGEIRSRSWLLIVFIGLGMGGFLLMDMIGNNSNIFGGSTTVGEIAGRSISVMDFQRRQEELYANSQASQYQVREGLWQYYIREAILEDEAAALGLAVSEEEFNELAFSADPRLLSNIIRQAFGGENGQVDPNQLQQIKQRVESGQMEAAELAYWNTLREQIILDRLEDKILAITTRAIYTPTWMAEMEHNALNRKADFRFVAVPYAVVKDDEVKVSDSELKSYIKENKGLFTNEEETRKFDFVLFNVVPTSEDTLKIKALLDEQIVEWNTTEDDSLFVTSTLGGIYTEKYEFKAAFAPQVQDTFAKVTKGTIVGPYVDGSKYKVAKLLDKKVIADSVQARHILRQVAQSGDQNTYFTKMRTEIALVDSLIKELEKGTASFDSLAAQYGSDGTKDKGGDLGVFGPGAMVAEFNDLVFYTATVGKYYRVITQFGVHIVQLQKEFKGSGSVGYQVAYIQEDIIPSQETQKVAQRDAAKFAASLESLDDLKAKAKKAKYEVQTTIIGAKQNDYRLTGIGEGEAAREIIKWGFEAKKGEASRETYIFEKVGDAPYIEKFAVVALSSVTKAGLASLDDAETRLRAETAVKNRKKAEIIQKKIKKGQSLDAIASAFDSQVQTASQISLKETNVQGMGTEPKVVGTVFKQKVNQVSKPIAGNTAVYVVEVTFLPEPSTPGDIIAAKQQASAPIKGQVPTRLVESLRKQTKIEDYRYKFF
jgi:peptidyl-prolyl cis-trans isomerase D